ncbi:restriction endonuclease subunit S [Pseudomonas sp. o96-267]|uniref:restriction endonuclease subunit S n=1 Tax=Pseudomonas sp. o96-267 TaxID=2479853 RepID=UPI000F77CE5C|nr:restriction endonuclease subunit S [Pseudomonas sp. o96-267]RRV25816.1 restriction endonuclease subunit S [Pseudomonas sp. o96-267]
MSQYKPYPAYKDSGVEWLGRVPEHWQIKRLKHIATVQTGMAKGKDHEGKDTIEVPYLRVANVQDGYLSLDDVATMEIPREELTRYSLQPGDVLMNEGGDFDKLGRGSVWQGEIEPCIHQNHVFAVRPFAVSPAWLNAYTGSLTAQFYFMGRAKQSTNLASISSSSIMELPVVVPPEAEIDLLLSQLDREAARIDALIEKKTRFIELLREKRQALITHAVTKGLDPNVKMKDSGVEWLGEVPEHWELKPLKLLVKQGTTISYGIVQPGESLDDGVPFVQTTNMSSGDFDINSLQKTTKEIAAGFPRTCLSGGEVILGIRASIGAAFVVPAHLAGANLSRGVARIDTSQELSSSFLVAYISSTAVASYWQLAKQGSTFNEVSIATVKELPIPVPPCEEQADIESVLNVSTGRFDALLSKTEHSITLLKERRSALITAAVTGQIDLRKAV